MVVNSDVAVGDFWRGGSGKVDAVAARTRIMIRVAREGDTVLRNLVEVHLVRGDRAGELHLRALVPGHGF